LGPEPLSEQFTVEYLKNELAKRKGKIKMVLLDQQLIGGLGNIYVDESLARAGLHPERKANALSDEEIIRLHDAINAVIEKGIGSGGTTLRDYRDGEGNMGSFQDELCVYGRAGELARFAEPLLSRRRSPDAVPTIAPIASASHHEPGRFVSGWADRRHRQRQKHSRHHAAGIGCRCHRH
jgi:DNA-formamidopyrimidine glycosylase